MIGTNEEAPSQHNSDAYEGLLSVLRGVFADEGTPVELVADRSHALWAVAAGTIITWGKPYRGLGVAVCSQAVLPTAHSPRLLYRVDVEGPLHGESYGYFEDGGYTLDPDTGERLQPLPEDAFTEVAMAIGGSGRQDAAVFETSYTTIAAKTIANR